MIPSRRSGRTARNSRPTPPSDDFDEDDFTNEGTSVQAGQEKTKQLIFDLLGRWYWIALGLILGILAATYYLSKAPKVYQARATLLIKQGTSTVMSRDQVETMDLRTLEVMNTMADRVLRPELLQKVAARPEIRKLPGLMPQPVVWLPEWSLAWFGQSKESTVSSNRSPAPDALAGAISGWAKVSVRRGTRLLDVLVTHPSPPVAKAVADAIGMEYQAEITGARSSGRGSSLKILVEESEAARARLQVSQTAMAIYVRALATLKELESRETVFDELSRRYLPKHPRLVSAEAELASNRERFLAEFDAARNSSADRAYWDANATEWEKITSDDAAKLISARRMLLARGNVLESEIQSQTSVFNSILTRIQEADINQQAVESEVEISSYAQLPGMPVSPVATKILAMGSFGGLAFGGLFALLLVRLDNKIHSITQIERETGLPALGAITQLKPSVLAKAARTHSGRHGEASAAPCPASRLRWNPMLLFREGISSTTFSEMFRVLRASILLLGNESKRRITLFSSALPGEGKTFVSSNFALAAASQGKRTLLIDLDLRKPSVHKIFGLQRDSHPFGSTEVLAGLASFEDAVYTDSGAEHLHLMLAGKSSPNPGELLNTASLTEFLEKAVDSYDIVVIDSAPLLAVPDTRMIASLVHNFCLVVRGDYASKSAVRSVIALLEGDDNLPCGVVFNGFSEKRGFFQREESHLGYQNNRYGYSYRYGYGSYGTYGTKDGA